MLKFEEKYLQRGNKDDVSPVKPPAPDFMARNKIAVTKSPKNLGKNHSTSGIEKTFTSANNRNRRMLDNKKALMTPHTNSGQRQTVQSAEQKYFSLSQAHQSDSSLKNTMKLETLHPHSYCRQKNEEMIEELKQLIRMITQQRIPQGYQQRSIQSQSESILRQVTILDRENERLLQLVRKLEGGLCSQSQAPKYCERCRNSSANRSELERERQILQQRLEQTAFECNQQRQSILISNQALMSQAESLKDRNQLLEKQVESLRHLLQEREGKEQETRRKSLLSEKSGKLSLSLIQQQYQESLRTMKTHFQSEVSSQVRSYQSQMTEQSAAIEELEHKLRTIGRKLAEMKDPRLPSKPDKQASVLDRQRLFDQKNVEQSLSMRLQERQAELSRANNQLQQSLQKASQLEKQIKDSALQTNRETELRINNLVDNYESTISILKKDLDNSIKAGRKLERHQKTEVSEFMVQATQREEELQYLREQLAATEGQQGHTQKEVLLQNQKLRKQIQIMQHKISALQTSESILKSQLNEMQLTAITPNAYNILQQRNTELQQQLHRSGSSRRKEELEYENSCLAKENDELRSLIGKIEKQSQIICNELNSFKSMEKEYAKSTQQNTRLRQENENLKVQLQKSMGSLHQGDQRRDHSAQPRFLAEEQQRDDQSVNALKLQLQQVQRNFSREIGQKEQIINQLQETAHHYSKVVEKNQYRIKELESGNLHRGSKLQSDYVSVEQHQRIIDSIREQHAKQHSQWQQEISRSNDRLSAAHGKIQSLEGAMREIPSHQFLCQQLLQIRKLLDDCKIEEFEAEFVNISEMYSRELIHLQQKNHQIKTLTDDLWMQNTRNSELEKAKLALEQKLNTFEGNANILDAQMQERKQLCDKLLADNYQLEKQIVLLKKGRLDIQQLVPAKAKAKALSERIDSLLAMEEQRSYECDRKLHQK